LEAVFLYDPRRRYIDKIAEIICSWVTEQLCS
jgi:hypothetical protein